MRKVRGRSIRVRPMTGAPRLDGADAPVKVTLEVNPRHAVMKHLFATLESNPEKAKLIGAQILDNALISAGLLDDATSMVQRMYKLLETPSAYNAPVFAAQMKKVHAALD